MLPVTETGLDTSRTVLRWRIGRFSHAPSVGSRVEDRRLDECDDPCECLAFDVIAEIRVWELSVLARERPVDPAERHVTRDDMTALCALAAHCGFMAPPRPPEMTVATFVEPVGFHPSTRQPLPGMRMLWNGVRFQTHAVNAIRAMQDRDGSKSKGKEETDPSVSD